MNAIQQRREETKAEYESYLELAKEVFPQNGVVSIPPLAAVQLCEDGAYVEAVVWIPKETLVSQ